MWAGLAGLLLSFLLNQAANMLDLAWGIGAAIASAAIGYGVLLTSEPVRRLVWRTAGRRSPVLVVIATGILTGLLAPIRK